MRTLDLLAIAGLVQAGLSSAIPALKHNPLHHDRRQPAVVETVTTTFYQTVIWVDNNGNPVSTEINEPPSVATQSQIQTTAATASASTSVSTPSVANPAGLNAVRPHVASQFQQSSQQAQSSTPISTSNVQTASPLPQSTGNAASGGSTQDSSNAPGGMGICYDMINSQTQCKNQATINSEFSFLKSQGYGIVRVYGIGCPVGDFVAGAAQNGLKMIVGLNTIGNLNGDLNTLIGMVNGAWSTIDTVYIGNEQVNTGAASSGQVAAAVTTARGILSGAGFSGNVVTVDTFNAMEADATICSTSDYCAANAHAFFDPNTVAANAGTFVMNAYNGVMKANNGKKTVITESGWPYQGSCNGQACPSVANQKTAMDSLMQSFAGMPSNIFMFQAYDAGYKSPGQFGVEQFFGIYDSDHYTGGIGPA